MCGIAGIISLSRGRQINFEAGLAAMNELLAHRGPDGSGTWIQQDRHAGFTHRRLSVIDLTDAAAQPMIGANNTVIVHNGEIYNYLELRAALRDTWTFRTESDTETILAAYETYGAQFASYLRGMFAFAIWDEHKQRLICVRDRIGIKPLYYAVVDEVFYFAAEAKGLLPFLPDIETDPHALTEYLTFQYTIGEQTLFKYIKQLMPGHQLVVENGRLHVSRYWDVVYDIESGRPAESWESELEDLMSDSIDLHLRSDVQVGTYISGGVDSTLTSILARRADDRNRLGFHGRFLEYPGYDESHYAGISANAAGIDLSILDITAADFEEKIRDVIYYLDYPVAGPGSFPQYMVSAMARRQVKVVLGGQGGDEIFGGYARYLLAYFEQCIKAAIDGTYRDGNYVVTIESIIPNLGSLREYKPLISQFWREGLFGPLDERYFRLINRSTDVDGEIDWTGLPRAHALDSFKQIFNNRQNVAKEAYFDSMTHFDFKCLLPALLHVEDRMSMAHGLESRVPLLDHKIVEFAARVPADIKFRDGNMKHLLKTSFDDVLPREIRDRRDKMGFPVPLKEWLGHDVRGLVVDTFENLKNRNRPHFNAGAILANFDQAAQFSRKNWALFSLELWHQQFHDRAHHYRKMIQH